MRATLPILLAGLALAVGACGGRSHGTAAPDGGALVRLPETPGVSDVVRALRLSHDDVWQRLGAHRFEAKTRLRVTGAAGAAAALDEEHLLEAGTGGSYHLRSTNSHDLGREAFFVAGQLYVRPRYGTFTRRAPEPGEADRLRRETYGALAAAAELVTPSLAVRPAGRTTVAGRPAVQVTLALAPGPRHAPAETAPGRQWRNSVTLTALSGSVTLDVATGVPLACVLTAGYDFREGGERRTATLEYHGSVTPGITVAVTAPAHVPSPTRTRYQVERRELLEGLVPPGGPQR
jgi:hypothetical protein